MPLEQRGRKIFREKIEVRIILKKQMRKKNKFDEPILQVQNLTEN